MTEGAMFEKWCAMMGEQPIPASPMIVARFVDEIAMMGIDVVWPAVQEISRAHYTIGLADPTLSGPVTLAVNGISKINPPRSWHKDHWPRFLALPYDLQKLCVEQVNRQDAVVRAAVHEAAEARAAAGLPKLTKKFYRDAGKAQNGDTQQTAAA